ncbi:hypothetical protein BKA70DRAFT_1285485 [Coprinopsis sp. MPI-PUGE-AT-0042]|nr:hypothetical protein BKA70DRAFT_1285485 [Coprinopsis sp. MPI-PUGE-AT-0042]
MFTLIFSSTVVMVTFRDRARMHPNSTKAPPTLPAICRLPTIISCFLIVVLWIVALGLMIFTMVVLGGSLYLGYEYSSSSFYGAVATIATIIGSVEAICVVAQIGLLLAVGILGAVERKHAKRYIKGATMA